MKVFFILILISFTNALANPELGKSSKNIKQLTIDEKIGQMIIIGFFGFSLNNESSVIKDIKKYNLTPCATFKILIIKQIAMEDYQAAY